MKLRIIATILALSFVVTACGTQAGVPSGTATAKTANLPVTGSGAKVTISQFAFDPASITIKVGESVTWTNQDTVAHTVTADDSSWKSGNLDNGSTFIQTFTTAGTFPYHCSIHPEMKATVIVTP